MKWHKNPPLEATWVKFGETNSFRTGNFFIYVKGAWKKPGQSVSSHTDE